MPAKQIAMDAIATLPDSTNFDDIMRTLDILRRNERAMEDIREGRVYTTEEAKAYVRSIMRQQ